MEQKDINVNVFSAAPQTRSGEKVFNPNISSAVPQACAAKRAPTYSERLDKLRIFADEAAEEAFEDIEQRDFRQAVQAALAQLTDAQRDAIISEFWLGQKPDARARRKALQALRHPRIRKPLVEFYR